MTEDPRESSSEAVPEQIPAAADVPVGVAEKPGESYLGREFRSWAVAIAGWLVPGLGHALQGMWGRAL